MGAVAQRAETLLGTPVVATTPVAGGDICTSTRLRLSDGRSALIKTRPHAPDGFFPHEAAGLRWLTEARDTGGVDVPEVLAVENDCLVLAWVETVKPSVEAAEIFGRSLAATQPLPTAMPPETRQRNFVNSRRDTCSASTRSIGKSTSGADFSGRLLFEFIRCPPRVQWRPWAS